MSQLKFKLQKLIPDVVLLKYYKNRYPQRHKPMATFNFETHLVEHCNLNCKCCNHFSCIAEKEFIDVDKLTEDFARLSNLFDKQIGRVLLLGGEPLLHNKLPEIFTVARKYFPFSEVFIFTNGTLLLNQDKEFWQSCCNNNIMITTTKYPVELDWEKIFARAVEENVKIEFFNSKDVMKNELKTMYYLPLDLDGKQNQDLSYARCNKGNACVTLADGKMYTCMLAAHIRHFNKFFHKQLPTSAGNYVDIYKVNSSKEILNFLCKSIPLCKYCDFNKKITGIKWGVTTKSIAEWT